MKLSDRYLKIVEWSEKDGCYIGTAPGLISGVVYGDNEIGVYKELLETLERAVRTCQKEGRVLPPPDLPVKKKPAKRGTDEPFLRLMEIGGPAVLKLLGVAPDEAEKYRFRAVVLKEKRIEPDIEGFPLLEAAEERVFIEFQGYADRFLRYRLMANVMRGCESEKYHGRVSAAIIYTDREWKDAALPLTLFGERPECGLAGCFTEKVLTDYTEDELKAADPRLIVLAPFTVSREQGKKSLISKGRGWKQEVNRVYPEHSVPDALNVMGLFVLNRFRDITREEVITMLNFDLMDTVAGKQIYDEGVEKGVDKGMEKGMEKGQLDNAREMLTDVLWERFGIVPEDVTDAIYAIGRRDLLKRLVTHAVRCGDIGDFKKMLAKVIPG
ncbi:DUF2887 domain-containing protein [Desulfococcaceae bacterium HSG8]|nr:DUF2887 domain-containing protein [Desulfococcaceae bacterium HSG8]